MNFIMDREKLHEVLMGYNSYLTIKSIEHVDKHGPIRITKEQAEAMANDYIDSMKHFDMDNLFDQMDEVLEMAGLPPIKEQMEKGS